MSKTIKIIDLLNKIANEEEVPKKIKFEKDIFEYYPTEKEYKSFLDEDKFYGRTLLFNVMCGHRINEILNCEVEIIEDEQEIDIQKELIMLAEYEDIVSYDKYSIKANRLLINKLVQAVKQLDKNIKEK